MSRVFELLIDEKRCKGCCLCIHFCPPKILALGDDLNHLGYNYVRKQDQGRCTGCGNCFKICPELVFEIKKGEAP